MKQVCLVQVDTRALVPGMYIAELDCDWIDSPFLMQGFQLTEMRELEQLQALCQFVYVDTRRSDADSIRMLLETHPPMLDRKPDLPLQRIQRATASFVDTPVQTPARGSVLPGADGRTTLIGTLGTIVSETVRGGGATAAANAPTISTLEVKSGGDQSLRGAQNWRDQGFGVGAQVPAQSASSAPRASYVATAGITGSPAARRKTDLFRAPRRGTATALDGTADQANLRGPALIEVREKQMAFTPVLQRAKELVARVDESMATLVNDLQAGRDLDFESIETLIGEIAESLGEHPEPLALLARMKGNDNYAYKHALDCLLQMMIFAKHQGFAREAVQTLGFAAMLLDVGKVNLPSAIRNDTAHWLPQSSQREIMKRHVFDSVEILGKKEGISIEVKEIVGQHHERVDGRGYPYGLKGHEIDKRANMASIIDAYTAMLSARPHRDAMTSEDAFGELREHAGTQFDSALVEDFIQSTGSFAVGCVVELNTGEVGIVVRVNRAKRLQPEVLLVLDHLKQPYAYPTLLNLMLNPEAPQGGTYAIRREAPAGSYALDANELFFGGLT